MGYQFQWGVLIEYAGYFFKGLYYTAEVSVFTILFSTIIGMVFAIMQLSKIRFLNYISILYVETFRTVPIICLMIWVHYVLPILLGTNFTPVMSGIISISLNGGALACEAFRGGLEAIPPTQAQASHSLGFSYLGTMRHVMIPQAIFSTLPAITNVYITNIKNTALTMIIAVPEVMFRAQELTTHTFRPLEFYTGAAVLYILLICAFSSFMRMIEKLRKWEPI